MSERSMVSMAPETTSVIKLGAFPQREKEDEEIVATVDRLGEELDFNLAEGGALLYVLQVDPSLWPTTWPKSLPEASRKAEEYGKAHNWHWTSEERKKIMEDKQDDLALHRADAIAWAQRFVLGYTSKNLAGYLKDTHGRYPGFMDSFHLNLKHNRKNFIDIYNPKPFEPPDEKSDGKGSGGVGFLIGAVVIALLAFAILMYFLLR